VNKGIILYDSQCNLCKGLKRQIENRDKKTLFRFVPLKSALGESYIKSLPLRKDEQNSIILIDQNNHYSTKSDAVITILKSLRKFRVFYWLMRLFPKMLRDVGYDIIARMRKFF
jgi:predicted DCC family thiol-disulfide oxidoreductase YuxK